MYAYPVLLPIQSNREDFLKTVALFDDDTGDAIELSGRTLAVPGDFTGNNWTVTDGNIVTNSVTQLTIPDFPIGNQLECVTLTVGENLNILPGDPVTIADPTGLNTMTGYVISYAPVTGALVCQISFGFHFAIWSRRHHGDGYSDYNEYYDWDGGVDIGASLADYISIIGVGMLQILIPAHRLHRLRRRTYSVGMTVFMEPEIASRQLILGELPIEPSHGHRHSQGGLNQPGVNLLP
jgi:hypothetical protein